MALASLTGAAPADSAGPKARLGADPQADNDLRRSIKRNRASGTFDALRGEKSHVESSAAAVAHDMTTVPDGSNASAILNDKELCQCSNALLPYQLP